MRLTQVGCWPDPRKSVVSAYEVKVEEHLALFILGCMLCLSKQIRFLPEDPCQLLSSYSTLFCFFSHNNWKPLRAVNCPVWLRKALIIRGRATTKKKDSPLHQKMTLKDVPLVNHHGEPIKGSVRPQVLYMLCFPCENIAVKCGPAMTQQFSH